MRLGFDSPWLHQFMKKVTKKNDPNRVSKWKLTKPLYLNPKDERYAKHRQQLKDRGFADSETWSLDSVICEFILPRLIRFREIHNGYPMGLTDDKWNDILDKMIFAFDWSLNCEEEKYIGLSKSDQKVNWDRYKDGMQLFTEYFRHLWW